MNTRLIRLAIAIVPLLPHVALAQGPWAAALSVGRKALGVGECSAVLLDLNDPATKKWPRGPNGSRVSMANFDFTVSAPAERAAVGKYDGANSFAVWACPKAPAGSISSHANQTTCRRGGRSSPASTGRSCVRTADVCGAHTMPHAEVPFKSFWLKNTGALYLPGLLAAQLAYPSC